MREAQIPAPIKLETASQERSSSTLYNSPNFNLKEVLNMLKFSIWHNKYEMCYYKDNFFL